MSFLILSTLFAAAAAMPSYIAVPADQIAFLDLTSLRTRRLPRQTLAPPPPPPVLPQALYEDNYQAIPLQNYQDNYQPIPIQNYQQSVALAPPPAPEVQQRIQSHAQSEAASNSPVAHYDERPPDFGEYVDFGAHTGDNGAFGWYADYPINNHEESHYRK